MFALIALGSRLSVRVRLTSEGSSPSEGEAESDELTGRELREVGAGNQCADAQALFKPDDAVLVGERVAAQLQDKEEEADGDDDGPEVQKRMHRPTVNGLVDGDDKIDHEDGGKHEGRDGID